MNAIVSKLPLISEAPIEGKWYDFGTASREITNLGTKNVSFTQSDFNIDDINKYYAFAVKIIEGYKEDASFVAYKFFGTKKIGFNIQQNFYVFGFPVKKPGYSITVYTGDSIGNLYTDFPANCELSKTVGNPVSDFTFTVQLLGMK